MNNILLEANSHNVEAFRKTATESISKLSKFFKSAASGAEIQQLEDFDIFVSVGSKPKPTRTNANAYRSQANNAIFNKIKGK